jgi:ABC-2 type transport system permease protein
MKKYIPFILTDLREIRRVIWLFEMIFWPLLSLVSFGIFTHFIDANIAVKSLLFTGIMGWSCINLGQTAISKALMHEVWEKITKNTFSAPIKFRDFIIGHWMFGIIEIVVAFMLMSLAALFFFDFNIFSIGIYIPLTLGLMAVSGLVIGTIAMSFILFFGLKVDFIVWSIVDMIVFISGVYYSVTVFPPVIQTISHIFPVIYVFEGMRQAVVGSPALLTYLKGYIIAAIWIFLTLFIFKKIETYARKKGFYERYG